MCGDVLMKSEIEFLKTWGRYMIKRFLPITVDVQVYEDLRARSSGNWIVEIRYRKTKVKMSSANLDRDFVWRALRSFYEKLFPNAKMIEVKLEKGYVQIWMYGILIQIENGRVIVSGREGDMIDCLRDLCDAKMDKVGTVVILHTNDFDRLYDSLIICGWFES